MTSLQQIPVKKINGSETNLGEFAGKVALVVNVASKCGLTPQYEGLEKLFETYKDKGFVVLGFPANEFLAQEPGTNAEIQEFCQMKFGVKFPMFQKIVVKGEGQHPLYAQLTKAIPAAQKKSDDFANKLKQHGLLSGGPSEIMWNFEKFLINKKGDVVARFSPDIDPMDPLVTKTVESELSR